MSIKQLFKAPARWTRCAVLVEVELNDISRPNSNVVLLGSLNNVEIIVTPGWCVQTVAACVYHAVPACTNRLMLPPDISITCQFTCGQNSGLSNQHAHLASSSTDELQRQNGVQLMTIGIVGHDLRGPLSTIVRLKESMISLGTQGRIKELEEVLEAVFSNLEKILGLSNNLVDWVLSSQSGIQFKFEEVKMQAVADSIKDAFILSLQEKNITLALDIAENASAYADLECVKTICRNLIQNAIKFTPENKQISMSAKLVKGISNQYVQIRITDEGIGIAPRILEKIKAGKNTFSSGTKGEKGSGLGLIMVQALLSMNKGTMEIVTEVGKGTTFELLIPAFNPEYAKQQIKK
jgi:signal transduction histidine kinase